MCIGCSKVEVERFKSLCEQCAESAICALCGEPIHVSERVELYINGMYICQLCSR